MPRSRFSAEQKAGIVIEGINGANVSDLCRRHGISTATYYTWRESAFKAMVKGLGPGNHSPDELIERENESLKKLVGELTLANNVFKKLLDPSYVRRRR